MKIEFVISIVEKILLYTKQFLQLVLRDVFNLT